MKTPNPFWKETPCYYVSVVDGTRFNLVAGPYRTHKEALDMVDRARDVGCEKDPRGWFYAWGTVKMRDGLRKGILNQYL